MEPIQQTYNEETDSLELRVRGKVVINISEEDLDIIEGQERDATALFADLVLDLGLRNGV
jgi:hypothetical protein